MNLRKFLSACLGLAGIVAMLAASEIAEAAPPKHVAVQLIADHAEVKPGQTITLGVVETIEPGWHTYWVNPGDSGEPTSIEWQEGPTPGPILWPVPRVIPIASLTNYGYEHRVLLLMDAVIPPTAAPGPLSFGGQVSYLVCKDICVPEETHVSLTVTVAGNEVRSGDWQRIQDARTALPKQLPGSAVYGANGKPNSISIVANLPSAELQGATAVRFFPLTWGVISNSESQPFKIADGSVRLDLKQGDTKEMPDHLDGVLVIGRGGQDAAYNISAGKQAKVEPALAGNSITGSAEGGAGRTGLAGGTGEAGLGAPLAMLFAFLGGVLLNFMPCVFPVLTLKALAFAKGSAHSHRLQGYAYAAGVLASFAVLAAVMATLRETTAAMGWGFQFQSPIFVLLLAALFFVLGLSLAGVAEFGTSMASAGDNLTRKSGVAGYFFTGVLATVAATPCTAPFMGAAVGYAMSETVPVLFGVLLALGAGFALPMTLLSLAPSLQRALPKPGAWMLTLKQAMAFPLFATTGWLVWVLSLQTGSDGVIAAAIVLIGLGFALWLFGRAGLSSPIMKGAAVLIAIAAVTTSVRFTTAAGEVQGNNGAELALIEEPYSQARLEELEREGKPVFVNLTAAWCITCKVNERIALKSAAIAETFKARGVTYLKGDWTKRNPEITELLNRFGRAGVPLYVFYPGGGAEPRVLPQFLTESLVLNEISSKAASVRSRQEKGA